MVKHRDTDNPYQVARASAVQRTDRPVKVNLMWLKILKAVGRLFCKTYLRVSCEGANNVPDQGACLVVSNHVSGLDPFLIGAMINRPIHYVAKMELYKGPVLTWMLDSLGAIPINRGVLDLSAARAVHQLLRAGELIGIAPEGTRSPTGEIMPFTHGATKLALRTRTPLVPVAVYGTRTLMPPGAKYILPGQVYIRFGELFEWADSYDKPITQEVVNEKTAMTRQKIIDLFDEIRIRTHE